MAREAGIDLYGLGANHERFVGVIKAFEALVRADERNRTWTQKHWTEYEQAIVQAEREACAKVCEDGVDTEHPTVKGHIMKNFGSSSHLAAAIRARGQA
jgi:hypothetical protein